MGEIRFTWWNLGNFFDTDDDPISNDFEYTAANGWNQVTYAAKRQNLAVALAATHGGLGPELLAVAEIEHEGMLLELFQEMGNPFMRVVEDPEGTSDLRGIDVAVAYDERKLEVITSWTHVVHLRYRTRDLFEIVFRVKETGEDLVLIAGHWPSRVAGKYRTEPLRIAVAEHIAYLVEEHVKVHPLHYEQLRDTADLARVQEQWYTKVMVVGDFNDEPYDRSVVDHLRAGRDLERVTGRTNGITSFEKDTSKYRAQEVYLFNATAKLLQDGAMGTFFISSMESGEAVPNRYQVLDQIVVSRGLLGTTGLRLDLDSVEVFRDKLVGTASGRPRNFDRKTLKGTSDHFPVTAVLRY